jgi:uncharacterized protein (DUF697 family)
MTRGRSLTHGFAAAVAVVGFVFEPIPALDEILMVPLQYALAALLAKTRSRSLSSVPWGKASRIIWGGVGVRFISESTLRWAFPVGAAANASLAFTTTEILGHHVDEALDEGVPRRG